MRRRPCLESGNILKNRRKKTRLSGVRGSCKKGKEQIMSQTAEKYTIAEKEKCVICGKETPYILTTSVEYRVGYISGAGQLCMKCYRELYQKN